MDLRQFDREFGSGNTYWMPIGKVNEFFLKAVQNYVTDVLRFQGYLTLNQVYKHLGLPVSDEQSKIGWTANATIEDFYDVCDIADGEKIPLRFNPNTTDVTTWRSGLTFTTTEEENH